MGGGMTDQFEAEARELCDRLGLVRLRRVAGCPVDVEPRPLAVTAIQSALRSAFEAGAKQMRIPCSACETCSGTGIVELADSCGNRRSCYRCDGQGHIRAAVPDPKEEADADG